jgi:hypothetical protein
MAEHPEKREERVDDEPTRRDARARGDADDPREEEGWTQPESSAQKGAERDGEEG